MKIPKIIKKIGGSYIVSLSPEDRKILNADIGDIVYISKSADKSEIIADNETEPNVSS